MRRPAASGTVRADMKLRLAIGHEPCAVKHRKPAKMLELHQRTEGPRLVPVDSEPMMEAGNDGTP